MASTVKVDYINPFIEALDHTFSTMVSCKVRRKPPYLKEKNQSLYPISGIIGLSGKVVGTVVLTVSDEVALKSASAMLMMELEQINDDVMDAVGELTNMVAGNAKAKLEEYQLSLSLPNVIRGKDSEIHFPPQAQPITIPFDCDWGPLALEVGFSSPG